jgi:hypothetical protein
MNSVYITPDRFNGIGDMGICLPQTELRRGTILQIASFKLAKSQRAMIRVLNLNLISILTPGVVPDIVNSSFGIVSVGVYGPINTWNGNLICSPIIRVTGGGLGVATLNPFTDNSIVTPGIYVVAVFNNTGRSAASAIDLSVSVTGQVKFYL